MIYPPGARHSPITASVVQAIAEISGDRPGSEDVFAKVGDSMTVDASALSCFAGDDVDLGEHEALRGALEWFRGGDAAGDTPFDRDSDAAKIGMSVGWVLDGPLDQELAAIGPRYALVQYGTNDLQLGTTPLTAIWAFGEGMLELSDRLTAHGVVPLWTTIPPRLDSAGLDAWVPTYNAVIRGVAQASQTPLMDLHGALGGEGLTGDGVHLAALDGWRGCLLTDEGLEHGNNIRNLLWLEALDRVLAARDGQVLDEGTAVRGSGTFDAPWEIEESSFSIRADTRLSDERRLDAYPGCDADQDESGAEHWYRLPPGRHQVFVFDADGVDVDLHVVDSSRTGEGCIDRDHRYLDVELQDEAFLVVDTFVSGGEELAGDYLLVVTE